MVALASISTVSTEAIEPILEYIYNTAGNKFLNDLGAVISHVTVAWSDAEAEQQHHK